jgi:hypothetical protein
MIESVNDALTAIGKPRAMARFGRGRRAVRRDRGYRRLAAREGGCCRTFRMSVAASLPVSVCMT